MPTDPASVLDRLTERLAPLERSLHLAWWAAATDARPETSAARQRAEEALLAVLAERVFVPGASLTWRDLVVAATGRPLGPEAFPAGLG
jgi:hypothetical protein